MARISHRQRIHDAIRDRILRGEVSPDDRLIDTSIAGDMGVSRMPAREALMQLVSEGYLESTTRGFALPRLGPERVAEIFLLRRLLEPHATAIAAQNRSEVDLLKLQRAFHDSESTLRSADFEAFYHASESFRDAWLCAVPNGELRSAIQRYAGQVQTVRLITMRDPWAHRTVVAGQHDLLDAFECRDPLRAVDVTLRFVFEAEASYRRLQNVDQRGE